jgi:NAD(P)-dependent dehydrogenase (short-subunit alcohol dehydrogenase family)
MAKLDGKVAVVTGGASGIGEGTVRLFVEEGARVTVADIQDERGQALAEELGPNVMYVHADVADESDVASAIQRSVERFGRLDCMFSNAGIGGAGGPIDQIPMEAYDATMAVLLRGVFAGIKHAAAIMKEQRSGSIISTASVAGMQAGYGGHVYSAAKAAIIHLTRTVAVELGEYGVRVNCICPGAIATPIFGKGLGLSPDVADETVEPLRESFASAQPLPRAGMPRDIAQAALWLASDEASFVTGHALVVDGGLMAGRPPISVLGTLLQPLAPFLTELPGLAGQASGESQPESEG